MRETTNEQRQFVECVWCKWRGDSPIKKILKIAGRDYPIECRRCGAIGIKPAEASLGEI